MMLENHGRSARLRKAPTLVLATALLAALATAAVTAMSAVQDRTITMEQARELAANASRDASIPITINDRVLAKLNFYLGSPKGREFVRNSMTRLPKYRPLIERKLKEHGLPAELLAVPLAESGYDNEAVSPHQAKGLWQFVAPTARRYGLKISGTVDERRDPAKSTDAALRYLSKLHTQFGDWQLALKSYNEGEERVASLISKHQTRDAWKLEQLDSTENYLAWVTAAMIVLRNPNALN